MNQQSWWVQIEGAAYWAVFTAAFLGFALWESRKPVRRLSVSERRRWSRHAILITAAYGALFLVCRTSPVVMAALVSGREGGLLNRAVWPPFAQWVAAFLLLDFVRYAVHRAHHSVPLLWRVHFVHHSDPDCDVSTAARFHPVEAVLTQGAYLAVIFLVAPPAGAVLAAELATCCQSFFVHANAALPPPLERALRPFMVTPDLHRIHHSENILEQSSNFGEILSLWDRVFRTYRATPAAANAAWTPGISGFQNERSLGLRFMLTSPFLTSKPSPETYDSKRTA